MSNLQSVPKLLRTIAKSNRSRAEKTDVIFNAAAEFIDEIAVILTLLEDVPGITATEKVTRLKQWYQELCDDGKSM